MTRGPAPLVAGISRARRWRAARQRRTQLRQVGRLLAANGRGAGAVVGVLGSPSDHDLSLVRRAADGARIVVLAKGQRTRWVTAALEGPFDAMLDFSARPAMRRRNFETCFFHVRPGGPYVVFSGAEDLDQTEMGLGQLLAEAADASDEPVREVRGTNLRQQHLMTVKQHVETHVAGPHAVFSHDLSDVWMKTRESEYNEFLAATGGRHTVLATFPPPEPPARAAGVEGPKRRKPRMHRRINRAELNLREYRDVEVYPPQIVVDGRVLMPDTFRHNQWEYLRHRELIDVSEDFAVPRATPGEARRLTGTWLHLDNEVRGHFGHLLTESVSRFWTWEEARRIDPEVRVIVGATSVRPEIMPYEMELYEAGGIPADRIVVIDGPVQVERLISGSPMFSHPEFVHPRIIETWDRVGDSLAEKASSGRWPRRLFIGRKTSKRACANSDEVEAIFADHGFEVIFPEEHSLGDQVQMFRDAEAIGGYAGSGLFQTMFVKEPKHVIQVCPRSYIPRNEYLIAAVRGHRLDSVVARNRGRSVKTSYAFDLEREGAFLRDLLQEHLPVDQE